MGAARGNMVINYVPIFLYVNVLKVTFPSRGGFCLAKIDHVVYFSGLQSWLYGMQGVLTEARVFILDS